MKLPHTPAAGDPKRPLHPELALKVELVKALDVAKELERRYTRKTHLTDLVALARSLYDPHNPTFADFWNRFGESQEWLLHLCLAFKARSLIEVLPGFSLGHIVAERRVDQYEQVDCSNYTALLVLQSRETLKTGVRRIDMIHDMIFYPEVKKMPSGSAWFGHKLAMATEQRDAIVSAMCSSHFAEIWPEKVPEDRSSESWGTKERVDMADHNPSLPHSSMSFLAVNQAYEGGRYKSGHFDDLVTHHDAHSAIIREDKARNLITREQERDKICGLKVIQGTPHHPEDAYARQARRPGTLVVKLPCVLGPARTFFEFADLSDSRAAKTVKRYTVLCKPVFKHLDLLTLRKTYHEQDKYSFSSQMLLDPSAAGFLVFNTQQWMRAKASDVNPAWPFFLFCDPAFKKAENMMTGDNCAICVVGFDQFGRRWVVDGEYRKDLGQDDTFRVINELAVRWKVQAAFMEEVLQNDVNDHWQKYAIRAGSQIPYLQPLKKAGRTNKMVRIKSMEPDFRAARVIIVEDNPCNPFVAGLLEEAGNFDAISGAASNDDALDCLSQSWDPAVGDPASVDTYAAANQEEEDYSWLP